MQAISVFDIFKVGVGPSSSHTMGPWRAAQQFLAHCDENGGLTNVRRMKVDLYGSLAKTGKGHGTDVAILLGLSGEDPVTCDTSKIESRVSEIRRSCKLSLNGAREANLDPSTDVIFHSDRCLDYHPNGMTFTAEWLDGRDIQQTYFSIGGGFVVQDGGKSARTDAPSPLPMPIETSEELGGYCRSVTMTIPEVVRTNERHWRDDSAIDAGLDMIWRTMKECVYRGCYTDGELPGGLHVVRRAAGINRKLLGESSFENVDDWVAAVKNSGAGFRDVLSWVSCFALAVNEENAAFGRVVTAPTNGAAGVIPAVLMYYLCFCDGSGDGIRDFLLTAGELGSIFKKGATLSAAMGGCQAEIGVSSAMAAGGLTQVLGGSTDQVLMAAEIAMEHHLGLTCDPAGGLVQIPCIERNTMGAVKAINAANIALDGDPSQARVSLDAVIKTMWQTALDMNSKYKETSEGGLALHIPVSLPEC